MRSGCHTFATLGKIIQHTGWVAFRKARVSTLFGYLMLKRKFLGEVKYCTGVDWIGFNYTVPFCKWVVARLSLNEWSPCSNVSRLLVRFFRLVRGLRWPSVLILKVISSSVNIYIKWRSLWFLISNFIEKLWLCM